MTQLNEKMNEPNYVFILNEYNPIEDRDGVETCWVHVVDTNDETYHPELGDGHWTDVDSFPMPYRDYCNFSHDEIAQVWHDELVKRANDFHRDIEDTLARYGFNS